VARIAYFDCFSGASGDMVLGALLDLGLPLDGLRSALGSLEIEYGSVSADRLLRAGVSGTKFHVEEHAAPAVTATATRSAAHGQAHRHGHGHRQAHDHAPEGGHGAHGHHTLKEIGEAIERSALSRQGKDRALRMFHRLGEAEAAIHDVPLDRIHLHEVGALDSIIDIVGTVYGMEWLGVDRIVASPLNVGSGTVVCAHGTFPVPAPATARLLEGVPVYAGEVTGELVTPTGALILTEYAESFGPLPAMRIRSIGYGAGTRDYEKHPNVLRVLVGESEGASRVVEQILVLECEIDDMNPQLFGPLMDRLQQAGALDVFYAPVQMKKNRPGTLVTVLAPPAEREGLTGILFAETTTIGVRFQEVQRERLEREITSIATPVGPIRFKVATRDGRVFNASPEFDDCAKAAAEHGLPIKDVQAIASKAWLDTKEPES
jgi:uncharacterized protein (TIGR00299 family) protein